MDNEQTNTADAAEKARGTASLLAANLMANAYFKKGPTPGGYYRSELNSVCYVEIALLTAIGPGGIPDENDFARWEAAAGHIAGSLPSVSVRKTAASFYIIYIVPENCTDGESMRCLSGILAEKQKNMEKAGYIAETLTVDAGTMTYSVISGRKLDNRNLKKVLETTLKGSARLSGGEQLDEARRSVESAREKYRSIQADERSRTSGPSLLIFLIVANVLVFLADLYFEYRTGNDILRQWGVQDNTLIMQGEWWRLITSMFLHADWMHLLSNMIFLYMLGRSLSLYYGNLHMWLIYFFGGLSGNVLGLLFSTARSLGASGAIMGLGGALLYRMTLGKNAATFRHAGNFTWLALTVGFNLVYGLFTPGIDNYGHFGGFIGGFIAALIIGKIAERKQAAADIES